MSLPALRVIAPAPPLNVTSPLNDPVVAEIEPLNVPAVNVLVLGLKVSPAVSTSAP